MWDVGGQATKLWKHYFDHIDAIIFAVDSTANQKYMQKSKQEIVKLLKDPALEKVPVLLMMNKMDLKDTLEF
jgi:small GTP-binding protein